MFCTNCGSQMSDASAFCPSCGAKIGGGASGTPVSTSSAPSQSILLLNMDYIPDKKISVLGLVKGNSAQSRNAGKDLMAGFKNMVGGEISGYSEMTATARELSLTRLKEAASALGADAVLNIRFTSASLSVQGIAEVAAYGTAVKIIEE